MPGWCTRHNCHTIDDQCPECEGERCPLCGGWGFIEDDGERQRYEKMRSYLLGLLMTRELDFETLKQVCSECDILQGDV